jgi:DNA helicase II / ATP-dependent DNA helicase PcrA
VLPELGEQMIQETTMETLASELLDDKIKFQTFAEQVSLQMDGRDEAYAARIQFKATSDVLKKLEDYGRRVRNSRINATDLKIGLFTLDADWIDARFRRCAGRAAGEQITAVLNAVVEHMRYQHGKEVTGKLRAKVRAELKGMLTDTTLKTAYKNFYAWLGEPQMLKLLKGGKYEYSDVFPLIYLKMVLDGAAEMNHIKHVVIDEMQDYTPIQYEVIAHLFPCKKTVLGDHNQSVSPLSSSSAEAIREILPQSECMYMHKSYRSTLQITELAQTIHRNPNLIPIERHGEKPTIIACDDSQQELDQIRHTIRSFFDSPYNSLGIICKTQQQADWLYEQLRHGRETIHLLTPHSTIFSHGVMIVTAFVAKGLEFDQVLVPFCGDTEYNRIIDRHMLYVACTRAMHRLSLTHTAEPSRFLGSALARSVAAQQHAHSLVA